MIELKLTGEAVRVLGCLVEKERATPEYYPLSLNALTNACNQKSNRDPVMALSESDVLRALDSLRGAGLALQSADGGRVARYAHNLVGKLHVDRAETALLAELLLRGPQTPGELRGRVERMQHFADLAELEAALAHLMEMDPPLVARLARQPGRKEARWAQLLGGPPSPDEMRPAESAPLAPRAVDADDRVARLEEEVRALQSDVARLWKELRSLTMEPE